MDSTVRDPLQATDSRTEDAQLTPTIPPASEQHGAYGRFKPTIYWYTPILMVLSAAVLVGFLALVIRRLARAAEERAWGDAERLRAYSDPAPARAESPSGDSTSAP